MNKKLTREQVEWLISKFEHWEKKCISISISMVKKIIIECTKQQFPKLCMHNAACELIAEIEHDDENLLAIFVPRSLTYKQFKTFTQGCIKICEWLEEQND